jgi:hypothetical protein
MNSIQTTKPGWKETPHRFSPEGRRLPGRRDRKDLGRATDQINLAGIKRSIKLREFNCYTGHPGA